MSRLTTYRGRGLPFGILSILAAAALGATAGAASAQVAAPASGQAGGRPAYSTAHTNVGTLFADPAAKAVVAKHIPTLLAKEWINEATEMTLEQLQLWAPDIVGEKILAAIDAELSKLAPKK